jgi:HD-GYP domain-containing protein (c-di-GMP phosphodiesterase class II)
VTRLLREHPAIGARILAEVEDYSDIARIVRSHHERWDGAGYPDGLAGHAIPRLARIIAVADSYNAMTMNRPYRAAMSTERAIQQLVLGKGTQFEAPIVDAFIRDTAPIAMVGGMAGRGADANAIAATIRGADQHVWIRRSFTRWRWLQRRALFLI